MLLYILVLLLSILSLFIVHKKKATSIFYLPVVFVLIEIVAVFLHEIGQAEGLNGITFIVLLIFLFFNIEKKIERISVVLFSLMTILLVIFIINISQDLSFINKVSRIGNFILVLMLIPIAIINGKYVSEREVLRQILIATIIYTSYVFISSLLNYGPNHYNTGIIYGFMFSQWYFGAFAICILPAYLVNFKYNQTSIIISLILLIMILLVLRRTAWIIVIMTILLTVVLAPRFKNKFKFISISIIVLLPIMFIVGKSNVWDIRGERSLVGTVESYESEGRYIEYLNTFLILKDSNSLLFGTDYLFDEIGRYNHPREIRPMHGTYSRILFGTGIVGLFVFLTILIYTLYLLLKARKNNSILLAITTASLFTYLAVALTGASGIGMGVSYIGTIYILSGFLISKMKLNQNYTLIKKV